MSETTARTMVSMMTNVITGGTGKEARLSGMRAAGKTGTTQNKNDRWFVGFTPYYVGAVWFGYDEPAALNFSGNPAARAWKHVMSKIHQNLPDREFFHKDTDNKYSVMICADSGMHASPACKTITSKNYSSSNIPEKLCTRHSYTFNENKLASGSDPEVVEKNEEIAGIVEEDLEDIPLDTPPSSPPSPTPSAPPDTGSDINTSDLGV